MTSKTFRLLTLGFVASSLIVLTTESGSSAASQGQGTAVQG